MSSTLEHIHCGFGEPSNQQDQPSRPSPQPSTPSHDAGQCQVLSQEDEVRQSAWLQLPSVGEGERPRRV